MTDLRSEWALTGSSVGTAVLIVVVVVSLVVVVIEHGVHLGAGTLAGVHFDEAGWPLRDGTPGGSAADAAATVDRWRWNSVRRGWWLLGNLLWWVVPVGVLRR